MGINVKDVVSEFKKFWLKRVNKPKYFEYKLQLKDENIIHRFDENFQNNLRLISKVISEKKEINFNHSGHLGDLVYALAVIKEISKIHTCNLFITINKTIGRNYHKHPTGNVMITERSYLMMEPFLVSQSYINNVTIYNNNPIDIDLDLFRDLPFKMEFHSIRWYYHLVGIQIDMSLPFLEMGAHPMIKDKIVIVRTFRGRNPIINYSFLKKYNNLLFLGTKAEYEEFIKEVPNIEFYDVKDFLEMAQIIKSSKLFISNQTFSFAIAEGLKVNRILEANPFLPVVFPIGGEGYDFYFQDQFEKLFSKLNS